MGNVRSSLVVAGGMITIVGIVLFASLDGDAWLALTAGGVVALVCGFVLDEIDTRVEPPSGYHFCPFCSTLVTEGAERCTHCNGIQDWVAHPGGVPLQPNS